MPNELVSEPLGSDESLTPLSGDDNQQQTLDVEPDAEVEPVETAEPVAAAETPILPSTVETETAPTDTRIPATSPYANLPGVFTDEERQSLEAYLPPEVIATLEKATDRRSKQISHAAIQAYEQQQDEATELGIPASFMRDVRTYADRVPEEVRGTKQGAQVAAMYGIYDRAQKSGDFIGELEKFVKAARPAPETPVKPAAAPVQPIQPAARVGASQVSGRAVAAPAARANGAKDTVRDYFGFPDEA